MAVAYDTKTLTLAVATAQNLVAILLAEGYTGSMIGAFLELEDINGLGDVFHGGSSAVSAANGSPLTLYTRTAPPAVDPARIWLFSTAGGDIRCIFEPGPVF